MGGGLWEGAAPRVTALVAKPMPPRGLHVTALEATWRPTSLALGATVDLIARKKHCPRPTVLLCS